ncbi:unnamed protein product, partial [Meganyctiphanes norvegica]
MDTKDYDHVRNLTLLFFLDRLMDKGQPRTLHDLSCQFGTKGFTKEMRQIAGGSQAGLRKFLQQYPSLFTLDGDYVTVTNYNNGIHNPTDPTGKLLGKRDYAQEAVDYFVGKLRQYGAGTEVPIKSLLGHRSQASPEVRHVSGQHVKEFRDFLCRFPEVFVVREETVILKEHEGAVPQPFRELDEPRIDPALMQQVLQYCQAALIRGPLITETLFNGITNAFPKDTWTQICRNSTDLATFLKMHSNTFSIHSNMVHLVQHQHPSGYIQPPLQPSPIVQQPPPVLQQPSQIIQNQPMLHQNQQQWTSPMHDENQPPSPSPGSPTRQIINHQPLQQQQQLINQPPLQQQPPPPSQNQNAHVAQQNQTLKARVNSLLRKTLADNSERDRVSYVVNNDTGGSEGVTGRLLRHTRVVVSVKEARQLINAVLNARQPVSFDGEGVNLGPSGPMTLLQIGLVSGQIYIFDVMVERNLMYEGGLKELLESNEVVKVAHDCRGDAGALFHQFGVTLNNVFDTQAAHAVLQQQETGKPVYKVKNVSLNTLCRSYNAPVNPRKDQVKVTYSRTQSLSMVAKLFEGQGHTITAQIKVAHDCRGDAGALFHQFGVTLNNVFDTQAAHAVLQQQETGKPKRPGQGHTITAQIKVKVTFSRSRVWKSVMIKEHHLRVLLVKYLQVITGGRDQSESTYIVYGRLK